MFKDYSHEFIRSAVGQRAALLPTTLGGLRQSGRSDSVCLCCTSTHSLNSESRCPEILRVMYSMNDKEADMRLGVSMLLYAPCHCRCCRWRSAESWSRAHLMRPRGPRMKEESISELCGFPATGGQGPACLTKYFDLRP